MNNKRKMLVGIMAILSVAVLAARPATAIRWFKDTHAIKDGVYENHALGEITIRTEYNASKDFTNWKVTGNKAIDIKLGCLANPNNATILVEHMHADVIVESTKAGFDELTQDSMDDEFHGVQGGFFVNQTYWYYETFSIEGSSPEFQQSFGWVYENYYSGTFTSYKYSEESLVNDYGVYGTTLYVVFDVLVKYSGEEYFHKFIVTDNVFINATGGVADSTGNAADLPSTTTIPGFPVAIVAIVSVAVVVVLGRRKMARSRAK